MACSTTQAKQVLDKLFEGSTLKHILAEMGITSSAFHGKLNEDPSLASLYTRAQLARTENLVEEIVHISDTEPDPNRARVRTDARKWYASKINAKKYGDRVDLNVNAMVDIGAALAAARARSLPPRDLKTITQPEPIEVTHVELNNAVGSQPIAPQPMPELTEEDLFS
jgi:hypothetical protein